MKLRRVKEFLVMQVKIIMGNRFGLVGASIIVFFCVVGLLAPVVARRTGGEAIGGKPR